MNYTLLKDLDFVVLDSVAVLYLVALVLRLIAFSKDKAERAAKWSFILALAVHTVGLLLRWFEAGLVEVAAVESATGKTLRGAQWLYTFLSHPPFTNLYETLVFFAWGIGVATAVAERRKRPGLVGAFSLVLLWVAMGLASLSVDKNVEPLVPALRSFWLHAHVAFASFAYAAFALAAVNSVLFLLKDGVRPAWFGIAASLAGVSTCMALGRAGLLSMKYGAAAVGMGNDGKVARLMVLFKLQGEMGNRAYTPRFEVPGAGLVLAVSFVLFLGATVQYYLNLRSGKAMQAKVGKWLLAMASVSLMSVGIGSAVYCVVSEPLGLDARSAARLGVQQALGEQDEAARPPVKAARALARPPYRLSPMAFPYDFGLIALVLGCSALALVAGSRRIGLAQRLADAKKLEHNSHTATLIGFPLMTLVIVTGAVWANYAWGRYWGWDPKETWSLITWFVYALYLHARFTKGWSGRRAALISVIGFVSVVFTFLGVNLLLSGLHSYATG